MPKLAFLALLHDASLKDSHSSLVYICMVLGRSFCFYLFVSTHLPLRRSTLICRLLPLGLGLTSVRGRQGLLVRARAQLARALLAPPLRNAHWSKKSQPHLFRWALVSLWQPQPPNLCQSSLASRKTNLPSCQNRLVALDRFSICKFFHLKSSSH